MAKQLTFDQIGGNSATVDGYKWLSTAWAVFVQSAGNQLFAGAGFSTDEHGGTYLR